MVVARSLLLPLERVSTFPTRRVSLLLCTQIPERTSMIEILEIRVTSLSSVSRKEGSNPRDRFLFPRFSSIEPGNLGTMEILERESERREKEKERGEGRGKKEFRPSLLLFALSPHERRYKRRNTSCLVNITGYRPCLGDRNVGQRRALLPLCIHRSRGSTPRFGAVTTDEFRMSPANGKQRAGR